jgi:hypothetical protein
MSDDENPYKSPKTAIVPETPQSTGTALTETMLGYLKEASPWLRFIGILGFIGCGLMGVGGVIVSITSSVISSVTEGFGNFPIWILSLVYLAAAVLFFFPAYFTYNFGAKIRSYQLSSSNEDLEQAFKNNKSLWKFYGILLIVYLAFIPFIFILAIIFGVLTAVGFLN